MQDDGTAKPAETVTPGTSEDISKPATSDNEVEKLRKQLAETEKAKQQAEMNANRLKNLREEEERKRLEEDQKYKELYEDTRSKLDAKTAKEAEEAIMQKYSPKVQEAAKKLFESGEFETQLEALKSYIEPAEPEAPQPKVEPLNPDTTSKKEVGPTGPVNNFAEMQRLEKELWDKTFA